MKTAIWVILALLIIGGGYYWYTNRAPAEDPNTRINETESPTPQNEQATTTATSTTSTSTGASVGVGATIGAKTVTITYTDTGFSPKDVSIKRGDTVKFVNQGTRNMWVAADEHPTHTEYAGTSRTEHCPAGSTTAFDQCANGKEYSFTFDKVGAWEYHNHSRAADGGIVTVTN